jgi:hypothetical protein
MPALKLQTRFLLRGTALITSLLIVWWFLLQDPMRSLLKASVELCGSFVFGLPTSKLLTVAPGGDWTFEIPIEFTAPGASTADASSNGDLVHYHSIDFDLALSDVSAFTFSVPLYWAIILAAPGAWRSRRALVQGTLLMALLEIVLLLILIEIFAHKTAAQMAHSQDTVTNWLLRFSEYLVVSAIPYVAPFVAAIWLQPELRRHILGWASPGHFPESTARSSKPTGRTSRRVMKNA